MWGPEAMAKYNDKDILNQIRTQETETGTAVYRYSLNSNEKLYILSQCLNNQILPESDQSAMTRVEPDYPELKGTYAFVVNRQGAAEPEESGIDLCNQGLQELKKLEVLDLYVYRLGLINKSYSYSTAIGMIKSVISLVMIFGTNQLAKKIRGNTII